MADNLQPSVRRVKGRHQSRVPDKQTRDALSAIAASLGEIQCYIHGLVEVSGYTELALQRLYEATNKLNVGLASTSQKGFQDPPTTRKGRVSR